VSVRGGAGEARRVRRSRPRWAARGRRRQDRALRPLHVRFRLARVRHGRRLLQPAHRPRRYPRLWRRPQRLPVHRLRANPRRGDVPEQRICHLCMCCARASILPAGLRSFTQCCTYTVEAFSITGYFF
jgi:hypothetical protein